ESFRRQGARSRDQLVQHCRAKSAEQPRQRKSVIIVTGKMEMFQHPGRKTGRMYSLTNHRRLLSLTCQRKSCEDHLLVYAPALVGKPMALATSSAAAAP